MRSSAIVAFGHGGDGGTESPCEGCRGPTWSGSRHLAEDESAKSLLQSGALAMESLFTSSQSFAGGTGAVAQIEPNIVWVSGAASAAANQVALTVPSDQSYVLSTMSASGTTFTYSRGDALQVARTCGPGCTW